MQIFLNIFHKILIKRSRSNQFFFNFKNLKFYNPWNSPKLVSKSPTMVYFNHHSSVIYQIFLILRVFCMMWIQIFNYSKKFSGKFSSLEIFIIKNRLNEVLSLQKENSKQGKTLCHLMILFINILLKINKLFSGKKFH